MALGAVGACAWLLGAVSCGLGLNQCVVVCLQGAKEPCDGPRCYVMKAQGLEDEEPAGVQENCYRKCKTIACAGFGYLVNQYYVRIP